MTNRESRDAHGALQTVHRDHTVVACVALTFSSVIKHKNYITGPQQKYIMRKWPNAKQFSSSSLRLGRSFSVFYFFYLSHI